MVASETVSDRPRGVKSARLHLREATKPSHDRLEAFWTARGRFDSKKTYYQFLFALWQVHATFGLAAAQKIGQAGDVAVETARIDALECDLQECLPLAHGHSPEMPNSSFAWGVSYVLNGSTMGAKMLLHTGAVEASWPRSYFERAQDFVAQGKLKIFFDRLNEAPLHFRDLEAGADATFLALECIEPFG